MKSEREIVVPSISSVIILMFPLFRDSKSSCKKDTFMSVSKREELIMNDEMGKNTTKIWKLIGSVNESLTGFLRNHNTGLVTDEYKRIDSSSPLGVVFTRSDEDKGGQWSYLSTYRLYITALDFPSSY